ncbi:MAG: DUF6364 family protein [Acidobacteriota bacterium]
MSKLTLSVDAKVVTRAKRYAKQHGVSVSEIVENYLAVLAGELPRRSVVPTPQSRTPVMDSLRGCLKGVDMEDYKRHLVEKYL